MEIYDCLLMVMTSMLTGVVLTIVVGYSLFFMIIKSNTHTNKKNKKSFNEAQT